MDYLSAMRLFVRVVELGSLSRAAQDAAVKTSTISRAVAALEADLGIALLSRSTRRLHPTEAGLEFYDRASRILDDFESACLQVSWLNSHAQGVLRIHIPRAFGLRHIIPLLPGFLARYPDIKVDMALSDVTVDIIGGGVDLAVRIGALPSSALVAKKLATYGWVLCASPAYLTGHPPVERPQDLCRQVCLLPATDRWTFTRAGDDVEVQVSGPLQTDDSEALFEAARCGLGIALLPTWLTADDLSCGRLQPLLTDWEPRLLPGEGAIWSVYAPKKAVSRKVRVFIDFVEHHFRQRVIWDRREAAGAG